MEEDGWIIVDETPDSDDKRDSELQLQQEFAIWREERSSKACGGRIAIEPWMGFSGKQNLLQIGLDGLIWTLQTPSPYPQVRTPTGSERTAANCFAIQQVSTTKFSSSWGESPDEDGTIASSELLLTSEDLFTLLENDCAPKHRNEMGRQAFVCIEAVETAETLGEALDAMDGFSLLYMDVYMKTAKSTTTSSGNNKKMEARRRRLGYVRRRGSSSGKAMSKESAEVMSKEWVARQAKEAMEACEVARQATREAARAGAALIRDAFSDRSSTAIAESEAVEAGFQAQAGGGGGGGGGSDGAGNDGVRRSRGAIAGPLSSAEAVGGGVRAAEAGSYGGGDDWEEDEDGYGEQGGGEVMSDGGGSSYGGGSYGDGEEEEDEQEEEEEWRLSLNNEAVKQGFIAQWCSISLIEDDDLCYVACQLDLPKFMHAHADAALHVGVAVHAPLHVNIVAYTPPSFHVTVAQPPSPPSSSLGLSHLLPHVAATHVARRSSMCPPPPHHQGENLFVELLRCLALYLTRLGSVCVVCSAPLPQALPPFPPPSPCHLPLCQARLQNWEHAAFISRWIENKDDLF